MWPTRSTPATFSRGTNFFKFFQGVKTVVLAAGYATRLHPLTENFPKPLLKVQGRSILDWLLDDVSQADGSAEYVVVTNHKFAPHFREWAEGRPEKITLLDDGTITNEGRLGAVRDLQLAVDSLALDEDLFVMAGDNLLDFSLKHFLSYAESKRTSCVMRFYQPDMQKLLKSGVVTVDSDDRILRMTEKSPNPESHWACPPFYWFLRDDVRLVSEAVADGCGTDAPGSFVAWLCNRVPVHAMEMPGSRHDIGTLESYEAVCRQYAGIRE